MSIEAEVGQVTRDIVNASVDAASSNLALLLKNDGLNDDQINRALSVLRTSIENVSFNCVGQYVSIVNRALNETNTVKKSRLFG